MARVLVFYLIFFILWVRWVILSLQELKLSLLNFVFKTLAVWQLEVRGFSWNTVSQVIVLLLLFFLRNGVIVFTRIFIFSLFFPPVIGELFCDSYFFLRWYGLIYETYRSQNCEIWTWESKRKSQNNIEFGMLVSLAKIGKFGNIIVLIHERGRLRLNEVKFTLHSYM